MERNFLLYIIGILLTADVDVDLYSTRYNASLLEHATRINFVPKNRFRCAVVLGVTKVMLTGSWGTTLDHWGMTSEEEFDHPYNPLWVCVAGRVLAEEAWTFASEDPVLDFATTRHSSTVPLTQTLRLRLQTDWGKRNEYLQLSGKHNRPLSIQFPPFYSDIRDIARARVRALTVDKVSTHCLSKRGTFFRWTFHMEAGVEYLDMTMPNLKWRLPSLANA
ncbi:hypothetical protein DFS33DRAFT_1394613 [Desarmillaria ectypa]|nr:hypothetical protein DFS33DRAFT_1394613 [Desarmillaria ectypa]